MLFEVWTASTLYSLYGLAKYFVDKRRLLAGLPASDGTFLEEHLPYADKLITLSTSSQSWEAPMYFQVGAGVGWAFPIGGGFQERMKRLATFVKPSEQSKEPLTPTSYTILDLNKEGKEFWINDPDNLKNFLQNYGIPQNSIPAVLPVKVWEHTLDPGLKLWKQREERVMGTNKLAVVKKVVYSKHLNTPRINVALFALAGTTAMIAFDWDRKKRQIADVLRAI